MDMLQFAYVIYVNCAFAFFFIFLHFFVYFLHVYISKMKQKTNVFLKYECGKRPGYRV